MLITVACHSYFAIVNNKPILQWRSLHKTGQLWTKRLSHNYDATKYKYNGQRGKCVALPAWRASQSRLSAWMSCALWAPSYNATRYTIPSKLPYIQIMFHHIRSHETNMRPFWSCQRSVRNRIDWTVQDYPPMYMHVKGRGNRAFWTQAILNKQDMAARVTKTL